MIIQLNFAPNKISFLEAKNSATEYKMQESNWRMEAASGIIGYLSEIQEGEFSCQLGLGARRVESTRGGWNSGDYRRLVGEVGEGNHEHAFWRMLVWHICWPRLLQNGWRRTDMLPAPGEIFLSTFFN
jgi:hypothetical protein